jgi:hypothetical protein
MKQPNALLKLAAVVSSLVLFGGFVSYRAGAFNGLMGSSAQQAEPAALQPSPPAPTQPAPTIMSSSKSIILGDNVYDVQIGPYDQPTAPPSAPSQQAGALRPPDRLPGPAPSAPPTAISQQVPPATKQAAPTIFPGTKSATIFAPTLVPQPADKRPTPPAPNNSPRESPR